MEGFTSSSTTCKKNNPINHLKVHLSRAIYKGNVSTTEYWTLSENSTTTTKSASETENSFQCSICSKSFSQKKKMKKHITEVHNGPRPFECDVCGIRFSKKKHLKIHQYIRHERKTILECKYCCTNSS